MLEAEEDEKSQNWKNPNGSSCLDVRAVQVQRGHAKSAKALITDSGARVPFPNWVVLNDNSVTEMRGNRE